MKRSSVLLVLGLWLGACNGAATQADAAADAQSLTDAASDLAVTDAPAATDVVAADATEEAPLVCDLGTAPTPLPMLRSHFVILGADGGDVQTTPMGGDPTGTFVVTDMTFVLPALAQGQIDTAASHIDGTGWASFTATDYRLDFELLITLSTTAAGDIVRGSMTQSRGTYTVSGPTLNLTSQCSSGAGSMAATSAGFTQDSPTQGRIFLTLSTGMGSAQLIATVQRVATP